MNFIINIHKFSIQSESRSRLLYQAAIKFFEIALFEDGMFLLKQSFEEGMILQLFPKVNPLATVSTLPTNTIEDISLYKN